MKTVKLFLICSLTLFFCNIMPIPFPGMQLYRPALEVRLQAASQQRLRQQEQLSPPYVQPMQHAHLSEVVHSAPGGPVVYGQMSPAPAAQIMQEGLAQEDEQEVQVEGLPRQQMLVAQASIAQVIRAPAMQDLVAINNARHATLCKRLKTTYNEGICGGCLGTSILGCIPPVICSPCCIGYVCCNNKRSFNTLSDFFGGAHASYYNGRSVFNGADYPEQ